MKYSVLLPTRNGEKYLPDCIRSVLDQTYHNMELVVSDNANTDNTPAILESFKSDPRLKVVRTNRVLSVAENWNNAFNACSGDYIVLIGDDDCLMPGYFERLDQILEKYSSPECVTYNGYTFLNSGSVNGNKSCSYQNVFYTFDDAFPIEGFLSPVFRLKIVEDMFRFRVRYPLNIQPQLFSRAAASRIVGSVFQPPFPDHYALCSLLLTARTWALVPDKLVVVGVSQDSCGYFFYKDQHEKAWEYLGIEITQKGLLKGSMLNDGMYIWLKLLKANYPDVLGNTRINRSGYILRQIYSWLMFYKFGSVSFRQLATNFTNIPVGDWLILSRSIFDTTVWNKLGYFVKFFKSEKADVFWNQLVPLDGIDNILEFSRWVGLPRRLSSDHSLLENGTSRFG